ncbi:hypothetical protein G7066_03860 [Leucobacter coleopterorum]|uniref:Integral membrane protein n=1 Tax=Leucobacter coleopterorum TaxID=2714933 RepID=A0ABX6JYI7_9MICO|nr:hypothetical protein [Leucobacter coleopterorum]QIM18022.1 hypothetical protein G7066_03860 [Leucobacter coleopterorum]
MILWFGIVIIAVAILAAVVCAVAAARKITPNDYTLGATVLVVLLLVAQLVISIVAPFTGNNAVGDPLEFWLYLIVVFVLPLGAGFWALMDRTRWANLVLAVVHLSIAVMVYRMMVIWG